MPAPKLLDKKTLNSELALEKKRQIESGLNLAKKVDAVRETLGSEEKRLEDFRQQSIAKVQIEIDSKIRERDYLDVEIQRRREERIKLSAPVDLSQAWNEVNEGKKSNAEWQERLSNQQIEVLAREEDNRVLSKSLEKQKEEIQRKDELSERTLIEAEKKFSLASDALERAERSAQEILQEAQQRDNHSKVREEDATIREVALSKREAEVERHEKDLSDREKKLKSRQEMFLKAQKYLQDKKS